MKKRFHSLYTIGPTLAIIVASLALVYSLYNAILLLRIPSSSKEKNYTNYPYHISLISDTQKNAVNENIFLTCKNLQKQYNCAVNIIFPSEQSTVQNLIAQASTEEANGIIFYCTKEESKIENIINAKGNLIPLVVISNNKTKNSAISHIGLNGYESGKQLASVINSSKNKNGTILALKSSEQTNSLFTQIFFSLNSHLENNSFSIIQTDINRKENLSSEDIIRDLLRFHTDVKTILCFSEEDTIRVAENIIDLNLIGKITVLGFGDTERINSYLEKDIIDASVSFESNKIAETALSLLIEYLENGYTNEYITIPTKLKTKGLS